MRIVLDTAYVTTPIVRLAKGVTSTARSYRLRSPVHRVELPPLPPVTAVKPRFYVPIWRRS